MEASNKRLGSLTLLLVGLALLVIVMGIGATFGRLIECPNQPHTNSSFLGGVVFFNDCPRCGGKMDGVHHHRVTVVQWLRWRLVNHKIPDENFTLSEGKT